MDYTGNDYYCDVALKGEIELRKEFESDNVLAFHHTRPYCPVHIVVIPKKHIPSFTNVAKEDEPILGELIDVVKKLAQQVEATHGAARVLTNIGEYQDSKHLHFHVSFGQPIK